MKNIRGIALFWAIAALAGMAAVYMFVSIVGQMPPMSKDGYVSKLIPVEKEWFWFIALPIMAFAISYFTELVKKDYGEMLRDIWKYTATGLSIGVVALIMSANQIMTEHLPTLLIFELSLMIFVPIFTVSDLKVVIIATVSNMVLVLYYLVFITPNKIEGLILLPGIAVTLLFLNMIIFSIWAFAFSILERIFSKEFWKSVKLGLEQAIRQ